MTTIRRRSARARAARAAARDAALQAARLDVLDEKVDALLTALRAGYLAAGIELPHALTVDYAAVHATDRRARLHVVRDDGR